MKECHILIVDDQELFAEGLKHVIVIESDGQFVVDAVASDGQAAIELARERRPDVILMDVRMPKMDGVEATRIISREIPETKIMILTTFDDDELVFDALNAGANGYVLKNIDPLDIVPAIEAVRTGGVYISPSVGFRLVGTTRSRADEGNGEHVREILAAWPVLTIREGEVLEQILRALRNREIAENLFISEKTVRNHISAIYEKLSVRNRLQLMSLASKKGLLSRDDDQKAEDR